MAEKMTLEREAKDAYEAWCKPRMGNFEPDHPFDAFVAGYKAAHLAQPAQSVDVEKVREVIAYLKIGHRFDVDMADKLTRAIGTACALPDEWREFVERVSKQRPSKPDYWSSCDQCERNSSDAEDLLAATPPTKATPNAHE